jgi:hypothetical protein
MLANPEGETAGADIVAVATKSVERALNILRLFLKLFF